MKLIALGMLVFCSFSYAQIEAEKSVSMELPVKTERGAKPYLLHQAVLETITQQASALNLDKELFDGQLREKFKIYFESYKTRKGTEKFGKNFAETMPQDEQKAFFDSLEKNRDREFVNYAKLDRVLDSYAFKQVQRDQNNPGVWNGVVFINLNKTKLQRYMARLSSKDEKQYGLIQILTEINPIGFTWKELGVEKVSSFSDPLQDSWLRWFNSNLPNNVEEVSLCNEDCYEDFEKWQLIPQQEGMRIPDRIRNNLWLKISYNLRKVRYLESINEWMFSWEGSVVLLDVNTKKILASYNLSPEEKTWRNLEQKDLNSALVSAMFRSPMDSFSKINRKIQDSPRLNGLSRLVVSGYRNLGDVLSLIDLLKKTSTTTSLELSLNSFSNNQAELLAFYQGEEKSFTDLLSRVKELKSSSNYSLVNEFSGLHHELKMVAE